MRTSAEVVDDLLNLMGELRDALEAEGTPLKGRVLEAVATDRNIIAVQHYKQDKEMVIRKRALNTNVA